MKKILLSSLLMILSVSKLNYSHTPAPGPLTLSDTKGIKGAITQPGLLFGTLNNNSDLQQEKQIIQNFIKGLPGTNAYQDIIDAIKNSQSLTSNQALEAFENIIMYIYHKKAFAFYIKYNPYYPLQGFRYSWLNPISWINPKSWIGDNNSELDQLINELDQLATIAMSKNPIIGTRMKITVHTYRHWRKYILATISIAFDLYSKGFEKSTTYALFMRDWKTVSKNFKYDAKILFLYTCLGIKKAFIAIKNFINPSKPIIEPKTKSDGWFKWFLAKLPSGSWHERKMEAF